ncbi:SH3-domain-containing protein [Coprinopsis marcescibilis]|uniref:SH3-domain-containing protein n=1 Tax=Coprinopsis marcescibilis TaxID=230819 RepID=A0A5C3L9H6_COPMA|nr:SH3-domain-containing protein [Coprinopsis marcescibilis]
MPFANLPSKEKDAFFSLLDEYFQSRPEIFAQNQQGSSTATGKNDFQASAIKQAIVSNPEATARVFGAGLRHAANASSAPPPPAPRATPPSSTSKEDEDDSGQPTTVAGRIAALAAARANVGQGPVSGPASNRVRCKFGDVDTSSAKGLINPNPFRQSNKGTPPPPAAPSSNSRFGAQRGGAPSNVDYDEPSAPSAPPPPPPGRKPVVQEEERGDWAEALYNYESSEAGDLEIREGQRVLVTERSSDDWWTGEVNGKSGLFPASYVKVL